MLFRSTDHDKVKGLLTELLTLRDDDHETRKSLVEQIRDALIPHSRAEESVFYNSLRTIKNAKDEAMHGYKEHMEAETLLRILQVEDKTHMDWKETASKLKEALEHHIQEEETTMFNLARANFTAEEAQQMGAAFEKLKPEIKEQTIVGTTWDMVANLMPTRFSNNFRDMRP